VATDRPLPSDGAFAALHARALSGTPLSRPHPAGAPELRATSFDPLVDAIAAAADSAAYFPWIRRLSGAEPVTVGGSSVTFVTRHSLQPQCELAEQYVFERFQAMGFTDVQYDPYTLFGTTARNVIATHPGTETPDEVVILCGHLDSTSPSPATNAPGANDNASGVAGVLLGAELLQPHSFRRTIRFVAFTGEEQGLFGSDHYAALVAASGDSVVGVVNLDMIAYFASRRRVDIEGETFCGTIMQVMTDACARYTTVGTALVWSPWGSDHVSFSDRGMPAFLAIESDWASYPCYHKTSDTYDKNLGVFGAEIARASVATAAHLAQIVSPVAAPGLVPRPWAGLTATPSPFGGSVALSRAGAALGTLTIHDVGGRLVRRIRSGAASEVVWDGRDEEGRLLPGGVYFVRLPLEPGVPPRKIVRRP
jgi:hypothetical protein